METKEIQAQVRKFQRVGNGRIGDGNNKIGQKGEDKPYPEDEEEDGVLVKRGVVAGGIDIFAGGGVSRFCGWPASRIVRVSRASGGKDRHSKVLTSKGLRDRRVRLSVTTAIQFYDLQDRLGYDQPSKAVEWLLKAAASSIAELPSLNASFSDTPGQPADEKMSSGSIVNGFESGDLDKDGGPSYQIQQQQQQNQNASLSKSACSSTSETSKGSGLSLSRSESRIKARKRARERAAEKEKERENESLVIVGNNIHHQKANPISENSSFTELLTTGITASPTVSAHHHSAVAGGVESALFQKVKGQWNSTAMDYLSSGFFAPSSSRGQLSSMLIQMGSNNLPQFNIATGGDHDSHQNHHHELQHFSFVPENFVPVVTASGESYNLNFSISPGIAGFNRGTLQSNSPSLLPQQLQRFSTVDGYNNNNVPFFIGTAVATNVATANPQLENDQSHHHHHFHSLGLDDASLQLCYQDGRRHSEPKPKGKN